MVLIGTGSGQDGSEEIEIAALQRTEDVDFTKEILPILARKCLACHNATDAESELVLETPEAILRGGSLGPAVIAGNSDESLMLYSAARQLEPFMPPEDNSAGADPFTPQELGLLKLWIDQGARQSDSGPRTSEIEWQPLPNRLQHVYSVAISPDGRFAAGGRANQIFLYYVPTGELITRLTDPSLLESGLFDKPGVAHLDFIQSLAFSPDGNVLASGGYRTVKFWRRELNKKRFEGSAAEVSGLISKSSSGTPVNSFKTLDDGVSVQAGDGEKDKAIKRFSHGTKVTAAAISPDGKNVVTAGEDQVVKIWHLDNDKPISEIRGDSRRHQELLRQQRLLAGAESKLAARNNELEEIKKRKSADDERVKKEEEARAAAEKEKTAKEEKVAEAKAALEKAQSAAATADESAKASETDETKKAAQQAAENVAGAEKTLQEAEKALGEAQQKLQEAVRAVEEAKKDADRSASDVDEAERAVQLAAELKAQNQQQVELHSRMVEESGAVIHALCFSPDGRLLAGSTDSGLVYVWLTATGQQLDVFDGNVGGDKNLGFTDDGGLVSWNDSQAVIWETRPAWKLDRTIGGPDTAESFTDRVTALAFSPDGSILATGGGEPSRNGELKFWRVEDGKASHEISDAHSDTLFRIDFSPDGNHVATTAADRFLKVFEVATGSLVRAYEGHTHHVLGASWRSDGRTLASASADGTLKIWNFETGEQSRTIQGFEKEVTSVQFLGDTPKTVASCGDSSLRIHNVDNGKTERNLGGAAGFLYSAAVSWDGNLVAGGGQDGFLRIWNTSDGKLLHAFGPD